MRSVVRVALVSLGVALALLVSCSSDARQSPDRAGGVIPDVLWMPDVLCMDLQDAQDTIQASGVFYSRSEDATGQDRSQIVDSNWVVVAQSPKPGAAITEGDPLLSVVKDGERACPAPIETPAVAEPDSTSAAPFTVDPAVPATAAPEITPPPTDPAVN